jgi:hypothetical protein
MGRRSSLHYQFRHINVTERVQFSTQLQGHTCILECIEGSKWVHGLYFSNFRMSDDMFFFCNYPLPKKMKKNYISKILYSEVKKKKIFPITLCLISNSPLFTASFLSVRLSQMEVAAIGWAVSIFQFHGQQYTRLPRETIEAQCLSSPIPVVGRDKELDLIIKAMLQQSNSCSPPLVISVRWR